MTNRVYRKKEKKPKVCLGIDGEGFDSGSVYAYMAAATADGYVHGTQEFIQGSGISTALALEFLLDLPRDTLKLGFSLGYDHTHWLKDLTNKSLYRLTHMEERQRKNGPPEPVYFVDPTGLHEGKYSINLLSGKLTIIKYLGHTPQCIQVGVQCAGCVFKKRVIIWDFFKFFQSSFIAACLSWKVISKDEFEILKKMKAGRSGFQRPSNETDPAWVEVKEYCKLECVKLARLGDLLVQAHEDAGLKLKAFYGAGSTSGAMLDKMGARRFSRRPLLHKVTGKPITGRGGSPMTTAATGPQEMLQALACAFFGGRFETSWMGPWEKQTWSYDISSAYPYAFTFLPCMIHGKWERVRWTRGTQERVEKATAAIVHYELPWCNAIGRVKDEASERAFGPFPFRNSDGNILFPVTSGGGWVWKEEFLAAQAGFPNVKPLEAWIYECDCSCQVLRNTMPENYKLRLQWGKEGKGIVSKLGQNGCYGKCAQTKGKNPPYQNFVWAGMTTASCRAQVLRAGAGIWDQVLMIATDGIVSKIRLNLETPKDTGTFDALDDKGRPAKKPLGGWEEKELPKGIHVIRPGIAFPLTPIEETEEKESKARGVGKTIMFKMRGEVLEHWFAQRKKSQVADLKLYRPMFHGMRSQIRRPSSKSEGQHIRGELYGRFSEQEVKVSYFPQPKRPCADGQRLLSWALDRNAVSQMYKPILGEEPVLSNLVLGLHEEKRMSEDQPDAGDDWPDEGL